MKNPEYLLFRLVGGEFSFLNVEQIVKRVAFDLGGNVAVGCEEEREEGRDVRRGAWIPLFLKRTG